MREGDYRRLASVQENHYFDCWQVTSADQSECLVTLVQAKARPQYRSRKLRLKNLNPKAIYVLEGTEECYSGELLMKGGFLVPEVPGDAVSRLFHFVEKK